LNPTLQKGITEMSETNARTANPSPLMNPESLAPYFDQLVERQGELSSAIKESHARTQRIGAELMDMFLASQKDVLDLSRQITLKPQDYAANIKAVVDATTVAQERSIALAKLFYKEQSDVAGEMRKWMQNAMQTSGGNTEIGKNILNLWTRQ
jgi:dsDNA-binding SOS-regulon protein